MDNSLAIGLATQKLLQQRMDVTANNLANVDTTGFKVESVIARQLEERPASTVERPNDVLPIPEGPINRLTEPVARPPPSISSKVGTPLLMRANVPLPRWLGWLNNASRRG